MKTAVVGHTEWIEFGHVDHVPRAGDIVHATDGWEEPGGGGGVASAQLARLAGSCTFYTVLGDDDRALWTRRDLAGLGVRTVAVTRAEPSRRAVVFVDPNGERTITTLGRRLEPFAGDRLPWGELAEVDAVYLTGGDAEAVRLSRTARVLVATSRVMGLLGEADVPLDAVVGSDRDASERYDPDLLSTPPKLVVRTNGANGGSYETAEGRSGDYEPVPPPGPVVDTYGAGDCFAAGLTFALASGLEAQDAVALAARCGAWNVAGRGPFTNQLTAADL
ncbi:MAG TPA: PfkB family carbohydrate kinase [Actinomycetota bacterium]